MITEVRHIVPGDRDWPAFVTMLEAEGLPTEDLADPGQSFFVFQDVTGLAGFGGFVVLGEEGMIRSVVVGPGRKAAGIGSEVAAWLMARLKGEGAKRAWLLTTRAANFFERHGFDRADRAKAPLSIRRTREFTELCADTAVLMTRNLEG
jgi:N-acetylglutamate synthase-like GNAT family acetyltransferase